MKSPTRKPRRGRISTGRSLSSSQGWSKAKRDLSSPQGASVFSALLLCAIISIILEIIGGRLNLPRSVVYPVIIFVNLVILAIFGSRIVVANRRMAKAQQERRLRFESDLAGLKEPREGREPGSVGEEES